MPPTSRASPVLRHGDRDGAKLVLTKPLGSFPRLQLIWGERTESSEAWVHSPMIHLMLKRLQPA